MAAGGVFGLLIFVATLRYLRTVLTKSEMKYFGGVVVVTAGILLFILICLTYTGVIAPWSGRFYSLWDTGYAKIHIPIIASGTFSYRGVELDKLLDLSQEKLIEMFSARQRRKFTRGIKRKTTTLLKKLRKAKQVCPYGEKPKCIDTHLRNTTIVPEMIGSVLGVYNGKSFIQVEIKPEMIGHYLGEFSITYKPVKHGRPGIGATHSSRFVPLK